MAAMHIKAMIAVSALAFALSPLQARQSDQVEDAMEVTSEIAAEAQAGEVAPSAPLPPGDYSALPMLEDYGMLMPKPLDYPPESWAAKEEGTAKFRLDVGADGQVILCSIIESSGFQALDEQTCRIAKERARFEPALDRNGNAVRSTHVDYMDWRLREPSIGGTSTIHVRYIVTVEGEVTNCEVIEVVGDLSQSTERMIEREPCPGINRENQPPYRNADGEPVAKRVELKVEVQVDDVLD